MGIGYCFLCFPSLVLGSWFNKMNIQVYHVVSMAKLFFETLRIGFLRSVSTRASMTVDSHIQYNVSRISDHMKTMGYVIVFLKRNPPASTLD